MCVVAAAGVGAAGAIGSAAINSGSSGGGGGGGGGEGFDTANLGQGLTGILSGGISAGLGISGLAGGNANQLQAGALAANPFGGQSNQYYGALAALLNGGQQGANAANLQAEMNTLNGITGQQTISTNTGALSSLGNISTPTQTGALANQAANPLSSVQLPASMQAILSADPYSLTAAQTSAMNTGLNTVQAQNAAQGLIGSGNQQIALQNYAQQTATADEQTNIGNLLSTQSLASQMGQAQFGNNATLAQILSGQQQSTFTNQQGTQQLQTTQQQDTAQNLMNILSGETSIFGQNTTANENLINGLLTATQASSSSPATAGGILANLGVANQQSAGNLGNGLGGLANGLGNLLGGLNSGSNSFAGDFSTTGGTTTSGGYSSLLGGPNGLFSGYNYSGSNSYGFTE